MKPTRLSMQLGLTVSLMCAILVIVMATLASLAISRQLDLRASNSLEEKLKQIEHSLAETASSADIMLNPHNLRDQIMGHDDFSLAIIDPAEPTRVLFSMGPATAEQILAMNADSPDTGKVLIASRLVPLRDKEKVTVLLSLDRQSDTDLLQSYMTSTLIALPLILLLVGAVAWWVVHRGLKPLRAFRKVAQMISARDLTHRVKTSDLPDELSNLAHAINFMLHRLDSDVQQLTQFSDDLAHELRSPMNNLMGKAQVTLSRERPPGEYKQVLESCTEELERMSRMVSQMLFLASVSQPLAPIAFSRIDLDEEVNKVVELFAFSAEEKNIALQVTGRARINGERLMIQRAISNLLSNAIRHSPEGSTISISLEQQQGQVSLNVGNAGEGIEAEHLPRLFDRFYRVHASRSRHQGGTGLGLAIVRSIMSLHEGHVSVQSTPGTYTRFTMIFPATEQLA
ncbi:heavy metal sensor histidine kinase [Pseudomonas lijiangensis]|uniref:heavy metal sensor histidine kinase n=1 Tax=Pseudomonas syringae group TaxID=136849 RepID=UPI0018E5CFE5|nr:heavy metal sensor histidine kinase [Pseudomonas cichorii]MBI6853023.1 heavy metal sensor histidine kinase [Pseudomonas cichorii]